MAINWDNYTNTKHECIKRNKNNGTYAVDFTLKDKIYNKSDRIRKTNFKTIEEAKDFIATKKVEYKKMGNKLSDSTLFKEVFDDYIKECELQVRKGVLAKSTIRSKKTLFKNQILPKLGKVKISQVREEHILKFQNDLLTMNSLRGDNELANQTRIKIHKQLSAFLNYCVRKGLIRYNPAASIGNFKKIKKEKEYLTINELFELESVIDNPRDLFIIQLLFFTGLRVSELLGLSTDSIVKTPDGTLLKITETYYNGEIRNIAKTDESLDDLFLDKYTVDLYDDFLKYRTEKGITSKYLFANNLGKCEVMGDRSINDMIKKYLAKTSINKNITAHKFRHSHAAYLISMGMNLQDIKDRLRHKDIRTTSNEYGHMYKERKITVKDRIEETQAKIKANHENDDTQHDTQ